MELGESALVAAYKGSKQVSFAIIATTLVLIAVFIPLIFILPQFYGELGVWIAFPVSDILATIVTAYFLRREVTLNLLPKESE